MICANIEKTIFIFRELKNYFVISVGLYFAKVVIYGQYLPENIYFKCMFDAAKG
ncbi:MAG: hypothetical protein KIPDCIKN_03888 [Haliscomenobacter sp.]|nr:hypothetical protein [Haliscomenobacter sp.]